MNNFHVAVVFFPFYKQIERKKNTQIIELNVSVKCVCMKRMDGWLQLQCKYAARMRSIFLFYELNFYAFYLMSIIISRSNKYNINILLTKVIYAMRHAHLGASVHFQFERAREKKTVYSFIANNVLYL